MRMDFLAFYYCYRCQIFMKQEESLSSYTLTRGFYTHQVEKCFFRADKVLYHQLDVIAYVHSIVQLHIA